MNDTRNQSEQPAAATQAIEIELGTHSVLVLEAPGALTEHRAASMRELVERIIREPGRQVLVLGDGITCKVLRRQDMEDSQS